MRATAVVWFSAFIPRGCLFEEGHGRLEGGDASDGCGTAVHYFKYSARIVPPPRLISIIHKLRTRIHARARALHHKYSQFYISFNHQFYIYTARCIFSQVKPFVQAHEVQPNDYPRSRCGTHHSIKLYLITSSHVA